MIFKSAAHSTTKDFCRFSIMLNAPREPIRDVWPSGGSNGIYPIVGILNQTTQGVDEFVVESTVPTADIGKYRHALVSKAIVTITAVPDGYVPDEMGTSKYATESLLTCTKSTMPASEFYGTGVATQFYDSVWMGQNGQTFAQRPLTKQMVIKYYEGTAPKGARITHSYNAAKMNSSMSPAAQHFYADTDPAEKDYLHVSYLPLRCDQSLQPPPTRFSINIRYTVKFSEPGSMIAHGGGGGMQL